jgi:hypothetical protein
MLLSVRSYTFSTIRDPTSIAAQMIAEAVVGADPTELLV